MKLIAALILIMTASLPLQAKRINAKSLKTVDHEIRELLQSSEPGDLLVAFDIDMTLTQPEHPALYYPALKKYIAHYKSILGKLAPEKKDWISTWTAFQFPQRLVESETPKIIKNIQALGVPTIAFTASLSGSLGENQPNAIHLRYNQLKEMGLVFGIDKEITFTEFPAFANSYPMFYKGILSANGEQNTSKGTVFCAFLKEMGNQPKVIVMVDDKKKHLEDMEEKLSQCLPSAQFVGIQYEGAYDYAPEEISEEDFIEFWEDASAL